MSKYSHIWLGELHDPSPVFRDEAPNAFAWPLRAVMAVTFTREDFPNLARNIRPALPYTEFYGEDGWPVELPEERKAQVAPLIKAELQVFPDNWREFHAREWEELSTAAGAEICAKLRRVYQSHTLRTRSAEDRS